MFAYWRVKWLHRTLLITAILVVLAPCRQICAEEPTVQYSVTVWDHKDGLPSTLIYAIAQTGDGFLWLGTSDGLVRFDGMQFTPWHSVQSDESPLGQVRALCASTNGGLWLGTGAGTLGRMQNERLQAVSLRSAVESIQEAHDGSLWVATSRELWHLDGTNLTPIQPPIALPGGWLSGPLESDDGMLWISTRQGLFRVGAQNRLMPTDTHMSWLFRGLDGRLALLHETGRISSPQNDKTNWPSKVVLGKSSTISGVTADSDGSLWIVSRGNGVVRVAAGTGQRFAERFDRNNGLSSDFARFVFEDREHDLWIATENGLNRLRRNNVLSLTHHERLFSDTVSSIGAGKDGSLWLATSKGLERIASGEHTVYLRGMRILSLLTSGDQQIWAGTSRGLMQWRDGRIVLPRKDGEFLAITELAEDVSGTLWFYDADKGLFRQPRGRPPESVTDSSLMHQTVTAMLSGRDGVVWFGLSNGNVVGYRRGAYHAYSTQDGLPGGEVHGLSKGINGELWVATERGLCFLTGNRFVCRTTRNGLPGNRVMWAIPDANGNLWLGYNIGVARLDLREARDAKATGSGRLYGKLYDARDGIESSPDLKGSSPAALAQDGRLWLTTVQGVAVLDPAHLRTNTLPPPVHILEFDADGQEIDLARPIRLRPLTRSIRFSFTAIALSDPQNVRFRYRLDGYDSDWHDGGSRRDASYTNLPPRRYVFRVCAVNSDGVWNDAGAALEFDLAPAYFQTLWFRLLCVGVALTGIVIFFKVQLRSAQRNMQMRYEERVEERARIAQELHDHLIQEMVGIGMQLEVADALTPENTGAKKPLERAVALSRSAIASGRLTLEMLRRRPMTGAAMVETLRETTEAYAQIDQPPVQYLVEGNERLLCTEIAEEVSEIGQEALRNALKHAGGGAIIVRLHFGEASFDLSVRDSGSGVDDAVLRTGIPGHYGLAGMRERAARISAQFVIHSAPGSGTTVHISIPAIRAYQSHSDVDAGNQNRWSFWRLFRRSRKEKLI